MWASRRWSWLLAVLLGTTLNGCASGPAAPPEPPRLVVRDFPRPAPLKGSNGKDSNVIRLQISVDNGELRFMSLDQPGWQDMRLTPTTITAERDGVTLQADELHWHLGETVVSLKDGRVTLDHKNSAGARSQILFKPSEKHVDVSVDGKWVKSDASELVDIAADTGRIIFF